MTHLRWELRRGKPDVIEVNDVGGVFGPADGHARFQREARGYFSGLARKLKVSASSNRSERTSILEPITTGAVVLLLPMVILNRTSGLVRRRKRPSSPRRKSSRL
jgi:hypothetical protein